MLLGHTYLCLKRRTTHIKIRSSGKPDSPLTSPWFVVYRVPYKKNYKEKISSGKHFHNVLCLSEAKGMDIKMKKVSTFCWLVQRLVFIEFLRVCTVWLGKKLLLFSICPQNRKWLLKSRKKDWYRTDDSIYSATVPLLISHTIKQVIL